MCLVNVFKCMEKGREIEYEIHIQLNTRTLIYVHCTCDGVLFSLSLSSLLSIVGPKRPHTYENPQWEEDTRKKLLRQKANPIEGISSRV